MSTQTTQTKTRAVAAIEAQLQDGAVKLLERRKQETKDFIARLPDHPFSLANKHMLVATAQTSWNATGLISMTGFLWWAMDFTADLAFPNVVTFNATGGPDATVAAFTSAVTGFFYVDPSTLHGQYNFKLQCIAGVGGEVTLEIYDMSWNQQIGSFYGLVGGLSATFISGTGTLLYNP